MNAIEEALQENIIETHDGMGDYCAFCMLVIEDGKGHSPTCPRALALVEYQKLVTALQWYLHDDETSVEMGILESVDKRPAYIVLREVCKEKTGTQNVDVKFLKHHYLKYFGKEIPQTQISVFTPEFLGFCLYIIQEASKIYGKK